jgi:hypothetical protein
MHHPTAADVHAMMAVSATRSCEVGAERGFLLKSRWPRDGTELQCSRFRQLADRRSQYFLHVRKLCVLAHYLCSRTRNVYKSSEYYLDGGCRWKLSA